MPADEILLDTEERMEKAIGVLKDSLAGGDQELKGALQATVVIGAPPFPVVRLPGHRIPVRLAQRLIREVLQLVLHVRHGGRIGRALTATVLGLAQHEQTGIFCSGGRRFKGS